MAGAAKLEKIGTWIAPMCAQALEAHRSTRGTWGRWRDRVLLRRPSLTRASAKRVTSLERARGR